MSLDLFAQDQQNALADASRHIAPDLTADFSDGFASALRTGTEWHNMAAGQYAKEHALDDYVADIRNRTGESVPNPGYLIGANLDDFNARIDAINEKYPVNLSRLTPDDVAAMTQKRMAAAHDQEEKWDARDRTWGSMAGRAAGMVTASLTDPAMLVTLPFGGWGNLSIAGRALEFGAIAAGGEALSAAGSGSAREAAVPGSAVKIPGEILTAGAFGLGLGGAFGALGKWLGQGRETLPVNLRDDVNAAVSEAQFATANVFDGAAAEIANRDAVTKAATQIAKGERVTAGETFDAVHAATLTPEAAEQKLRPLSWREAPEVESFDRVPQFGEDTAAYWDDVLARASPEERLALGDVADDAVVSRVGKAAGVADDALPELRAPDLSPEQIARLAEEPAVHDVVQHDLEHIMTAKPDMTFEVQTRMPDGSYTLQSRPLREVLDELNQIEGAGRELQACATGMMEAAE